VPDAERKRRQRADRALRGEFHEVAWQRYEEWALSQRQRFRELCAHPELVAE
jgi:hypothetical protein